MDGYLSEPPVAGPWPTGDLGSFDPAGRLIVKGRKDNVIVTSAGRNVSPRVGRGADRRQFPHPALRRGRARGCPRGRGAARDKSITTSTAAVRQILADAASNAPDYAKPRQCLVLSDQELGELDLLTPNGRPRRSAIRSLVAERSRLSAAQLT